MRHLGESGLTDPRRTFATHLCGELVEFGINRRSHHMAANAGQRETALGHFGGSVVRASRAKPRLSVGLDFQHLHGVVFGVEHRELRVYACGGVGVQTHFLQTLGDGLGDQGRCQIGIGSQQTVTDRVGC